MTIMRGGPGSGKSTYAKKLREAANGTGIQVPVICSADDYFIDDEGNYSFNGAFISRAHGSCLRKCVEVMVLRRAPVIIDNTNAKPDQMIPYFELAAAFGYTVEVITMVCDRQTAWHRQTHDVDKKQFNSVYTCLDQTTVPGRYRKDRRVTMTEVRTSPYHGPKIYQPYSGARCVKCGLTIAYSYSDQTSKGFRFCDHEEDSCLCPDGQEEPGEPFAGLPRVCNCGVSKGLRSDHEGQCIEAYLHRYR